MQIDLQAALPSLLPGAIAWAQERAQEVAASGSALHDTNLELARSIGVQHPELIRVAAVDSLPLPNEPTLKTAALQAGLLGPGMIGITFGYSVLVCRGHMTRRLLSHEFRHVCQYEQYGSIAAFLPVYLKQIVQFGYQHAPLEIDARTHELSD
jgi:hypothetical protein